MSDENPTPLPPPGPPRQPKRITVDYPKDLTAVYSNAALFSFTPAEMVLDFAQLLPRPPRGQAGKVVARIILSPVHAKMLERALTRHIANYERQFGEIRLPQTNSLADQFFRFTQSGQDSPDNEDKKDE
ncbi:MAG: hypothetical protein Kow0080_10720 [Candidatus Promineifilaceae bacterium]